ncbi:hypothetical protein THAOC_08538, partial [Thalassiosira oceanica]
IQELSHFKFKPISLAGGVTSSPVNIVSSGASSRSSLGTSRGNSAQVAVRVDGISSARTSMSVSGRLATASRSKSKGCEHRCQQMRSEKGPWAFLSIIQIMAAAPRMFPLEDKTNRCGPPAPAASPCNGTPLWVKDTTIRGPRGNCEKHGTTSSSLASLLSRIRHYDNLGHLSGDMQIALGQARGVVCDGVLSIFDCAPDDMHRMLNEYEVFHGPCNYICVKEGGISKSGMTMKDCDERLWERDQGCQRAFLLDPPSALISQGLVRQQDIDAIVSHAPIFYGYHPTRLESANSLAAHQVIEAYMFGLYNLNDGRRKGPVMEVALRVPSEPQERLVSVEANYRDLETLLTENESFCSKMSLVDEVYFFMSWAPFDEYMERQPNIDELSCLRFRTPTDPYEAFHTAKLFGSLFDRDKIAGYDDAFDGKNEYFRLNEPIWSDISVVLEDSLLSDKEKNNEIQHLLNDMGTDVYMQPDSDAWRNRFYEKLSSMLDEPGNYNRLIMTEYANLDANGHDGVAKLESFLKKREDFNRFVVTGDKVTRQGFDGTRDWLLRFYYDKKSCKMIMVVRSHFLMTATGPRSCQDRFNAIKNFQLTGVFSAASGLLNPKKLHANKNMTLTATMIYSRFHSNLNNGHGNCGSAYSVIRAIYQKPGRGEKLEGGLIPGQKHLQGCIKKTGGDLPFAAIQLGLYLLGEDSFNKLLGIRGCPHRIATVRNRYTLMVGGDPGVVRRRHWRHDDLVFGERRIQEATLAGGDFPRTTRGLLECENVISWAEELFDGVDETSNPKLLRLSLVGEFLDENQELPEDTRTDLMTITSKRNSWTAFLKMRAKVRDGLRLMEGDDLLRLKTMILRPDRQETCDKKSYLEIRFGASLAAIEAEQTRRESVFMASRRTNVGRRRGRGLVADD